MPVGNRWQAELRNLKLGVCWGSTYTYYVYDVGANRGGCHNEWCRDLVNSRLDLTTLASLLTATTRTRDALYLCRSTRVVALVPLLADLPIILPYSWGRNPAPSADLFSQFLPELLDILCFICSPNTSLEGQYAYDSAVGLLRIRWDQRILQWFGGNPQNMLVLSTLIMFEGLRDFRRDW